MKLGRRERWQSFRDYVGVALPAFHEGAMEAWREQMGDGLKGLAYRFYVEPFVILYQWVRLHVGKVLGR